MTRICVGSLNPVKKQVVRDGYLRLFDKLFAFTEVEVIGCDARSNVPDQPLDNETTLTGARTRAANARALVPDCDYYVGVEGGIETTNGVMQEFTWICVVSKEGKESISRSTSFTIPPKVADLIAKGVEHGPASDKVFGVTNSKHKTGTLGLVSNNVITRTSYIEPAVICAFLPFKSPQHYS